MAVGMVDQGEPSRKRKEKQTTCPSGFSALAGFLYLVQDPTEASHWVI